MVYIKITLQYTRLKLCKTLETLPYPPYIPDQASCDFWLFSCLNDYVDKRRSLLIPRKMNMVSRDGLAHVFCAWEKSIAKCTASYASFSK